MAGKGKPFGAGNPGNTAGRPKGARNLTTRAVEALLEGEAEALTRKAIEMALEGDGPAMRLCLDRLIPPRKDRPVPFALPAIVVASDLPRATNALLQAVADGELTPIEAESLAKLVGEHIKALEVVDIQDRLAKLEARV